MSGRTRARIESDARKKEVERLERVYELQQDDKKPVWMSTCPECYADMDVVVEVKEIRNHMVKYLDLSKCTRCNYEWVRRRTINLLGVY